MREIKFRAWHKEETSNIIRCQLNAKIRSNNKTISNLEWVLEG